MKQKFYEKVIMMKKTMTQSELEKKAIALLEKRGVTIPDIAELVYYLQSLYHEELEMDECLYNVKRVLAKREVQYAILTGVQLDMLAEQNKLTEPLQQTIATDEGLYGIDEIIAFAIVNVYGSIGFTNYGYIDKRKPGILKQLDDRSSGKVNTFLDDIVGAIAAAASSRLAHQKADNDESIIDD